MPEDDDDDFNWGDVQSDIWCRHWVGDGGADCEERCATCNHLCKDHPDCGDGDDGCLVEDCECKHWKEKE